MSSDAPSYLLVIPAKAGIHLSGNALADRWIPAFAGMTLWFWGQ
jgi:hypothetical protein